jgi:hypothetical protein
MRISDRDKCTKKDLVLVLKLSYEEKKSPFLGLKKMFNNSRAAFGTWYYLHKKNKEAPGS